MLDRRACLLGGIAGFGLATRPARAATADALWRMLGAGSSAVLVRHAHAPGTGDPRGFRLDDWATQRNLDETGRDQARAMGAAFRQRGVLPSRILSSQWRRCSETAELMNLGPVTPAPQALNSFFENRGLEGQFRLEIGKLLAGAARGVGPLLCVTHQVNITAVAGFVPRVGEAAIFELQSEGRYSLAGRLQLA